MSINEIIINALKTIIPKEDICPVKYTGSSKQYITFNIVDSRGVEHSDDLPQYEDISCQIHVFIKNKNPKPYVKEIRKALFNANFTYPEIMLDTFESDTGYYHIALECEIISETDL